MALTLSDVYTQTKNQYNLKLICGGNGLSNIMNWVYISEDINTAEFLKGGELIITTGLSYSNPSWLYQFIQTLILQNTCGIIINVGKYIHEQYITTDIITLCESNHFPLFIMPWEIHIYDITHDYYNRLFHDAHKDRIITDAFLSLIRRDEHMVHSIRRLEEHNYLGQESYYTFLLSVGIDTSIEDICPHIMFSINSYLKSHQLNYHVVFYKNNLLFICYNNTIEVVKQSIPSFLTYLKNVYKSFHFYIGISDLAFPLNELSSSYKQALAALSMSIHSKKEIYTFEELGFFKLLLSVNDVDFLKDYVNKYLGSLIKYDELHHSNYLETLHQYLLHNGRIQLIAQAMFCHRNTINYRIHMLKENLGYDLEDIQVRFHLLTSFYILDYLKILS